MISTQATSMPDPNQKMPAAVLAAAARSDEMFKQLQEGEAPAEETVADETSAQSLLEDKTEAPAEEPKSAEPTPRVSEDDESWEHRYRSMKGRFDRAQDQIRTLADQIAGLQNVIATMQISQTPSIEANEVAAERLITPEEENDYGSDFLKVVGKKAREEISPVISKYEKKIEELEKRLAGVNGYVQEDAKSRMFAQLDSRLPEWRELNRDQRFLDWLRLPDAYSGVIRHELLKSAYERNDSPRVLAFFNGFLAEEAAVAPETTEQDPGAAAPTKVPLDKFSAPGRAKSAAANSGPAEKPFITRAQIAKFYADVNAGKFRGRDAEKGRLEQQIFEATRDGRVR